MSIRIIREVLQYAPADLTPAQKLVLLCLAEDARDDRIARYSSSERLSHQANLSPSGVRRILSELATAGLIARQGPAYRGRIQQYRIHPLDAHHTAVQTRHIDTETRTA